MEKMALFSSLFILICLHVHSVWSEAVSSSINCVSGDSITLPSIVEGYEGDIEILTNIRPGDRLELKPHLFPDNVEFLELVYSPGDSTATVRTSKPLDADALKEYGGSMYYMVECLNTGRKNIRFLEVQDINDNAPIFPSKTYSATVSEATAVDTDVLRVIAEDADVAPENNMITYTILPSAPENFVVRSDGNIRLTKRLNYNIAQQYIFTVEAKDVGNLSDSTTVTITIEDFDNLNPYFDHSLYETSFKENEVGQFSVVTPEAIKAQDGDKGINEPVVYSITAVLPNEYQGNFGIDQTSGIISVTTALDREEIDQITIYIQAAQQDDDSKTVNAVVTVVIEDVDDNPPEFDQDGYTVSIPENSPNDQFVLQPKVTDRDLGGFEGTFQIIPDSVPFSVSPDGTILVKRSADLDREITAAFNFQVEAKENPPSTNKATANVNIILLDENDNSPQFTVSKYEGKVFSNQSIGMQIVKVEATDPDDGPNGEISYSIDFGNEEGYFAIDETSGEITLVQTILLVENRILKFSLYLTAKDGGAISRSTSAMVFIQAPGESHPQFLQKTYQGKVEENQSAADIVKVDYLSIDPVVPVTLTVESEGDKFAINQDTGVLSTKVQLDFEVKSSYTVLLSISDGTNRDEASVQVEVLDVNDNGPVFENHPAMVSVSEDHSVGDDVTSVTARDADAGFNSEVRYTLLGGAGRFSIDQETGVITLAAPLDRETQDEYHLMITAQDQGRPSLSNTTDLDISVTDINDNAPVFSKQQYEATVSEHAEVGTHVVDVSATDKDDGPNAVVTYHIVKQDPSSTPPVFSIDSDSGSISVAEKLDYGKAKQYTLEVEGRDGGSPVLNGSTVVTVWVEDVNDKAPVFSKDQYDVSVNENLPGGSALVSLEVTDEDEGGFSKGHFIMDSDTFDINSQGVISLKRDATLDRETLDNYIIEVIAVDQPVDGLSSTAQVIITVLDVNDNSPVFENHPAMVSVSEDHSVGEDVTSITARDADAGLNSEVRYTLLGGAGRFSIDQETGVITLAAPLDRETQNEYHLVITAQDQGRPSLSNTTDLDISVTDINDNAPVFSTQQYEATVSEHAEVGNHVVDVSATDKDDGPNAVVTYHIVKQDPSSTPPVFSIDSDSGSISVAEKLDYGKAKRYTLEVEGRDGGSPVLNGSTVVTVWVEDVNDKAPVFSKDQYDVSVNENLPGGSALVSLEVTDEDEGGFSKGHFIMDSDTFDINSQGVISLKRDATLDRETLDNYIIEVIAVDQPVDGLSSTAQVIITVLDVNDNSPQFLPLPEPIEIQEGAYTPESPGKVCEISATDADIEDNGRVTFTTSSYSNVFRFSNDGTLLAVSELDRETQNVYEVVIVAVDHGMPQGNNITTVRVSITDVNDNAPIFSSNTYSKSILVKDAKVGEVLLMVSATDKDTGNNALISYSLSETSSMVALDAETGDITLTSDLNDITEDTQLTLTVIAADHGTPPKSSEAEVLIHFKITSITDGLVFERSSYNFIIKENEPESTLVGKVKAITGATVSYNVKSHEDVFSVDGEGTIKALKPLDKEEVEWYFLTVEATDSRTPPNTAETTVNVQVENVNEAPVFDDENYKAAIFSIAPYKFPIVKVQASDPDVGESAELKYSLVESTSVLDVEESTGQLYVLDASSVGVPQVTFEVKATDKHGLFTTTTVEITMKQSASDNTVVISLNQPVFTVEKKIQEVEDSMGKALGWTVKVLSVRAEEGNEMRTILRESTSKTYIRFICTDSAGAVIQDKEVKEKLQTNYMDLKDGLENVFNADLEIEVEDGSGGVEESENSNDVIIIVLGVLLGLTFVGLITMSTVYLVRVRKRSKDTDSDRQHFDIDRLETASIDKSFNFSSEKQDKEVEFSKTNNINLTDVSKISAL